MELDTWTDPRDDRERGRGAYRVQTEPGEVLDPDDGPPPGEGVLVIRFRPAGLAGEPPWQELGLTATRLPSGGERWWFACPRCGRRMDKLHLPPGAPAFACRTCHGLTYWCSHLGARRAAVFRKAAKLGAPTTTARR